MQTPHMSGQIQSWTLVCALCSYHSFLLKPDYFSSVATVVYLRKENCMYQACPTQDCNKKVIDQQNGLYRCEKCDSEFPNFKYRMILSVSRMGEQGPLWCFLSPREAPGTVETSLSLSSGFQIVWDAQQWLKAVLWSASWWLKHVRFNMQKTLETHSKPLVQRPLQLEGHWVQCARILHLKVIFVGLYLPWELKPQVHTTCSCCDPHLTFWTSLLDTFYILWKEHSYLVESAFFPRNCFKEWKKSISQSP